MPGIEDVPESPRRPATGFEVPASVPPEFEAAYRTAYAEAMGTDGPASDRPGHAHVAARRSVVPEIVAVWHESWAKAVVAGLGAIVLVVAAYAVGKAASPGPRPRSRQPAERPRPGPMPARWHRPR